MLTANFSEEQQSWGPNFIFRGQRGNAVGFKLSSLTRIADTKSSCSKNLTLLHYIAETCESKVPNSTVLILVLYKRIKDTELPNDFLYQQN